MNLGNASGQVVGTCLDGADQFVAVGSDQFGKLAGLGAKGFGQRVRLVEQFGRNRVAAGDQKLGCIIHRIVYAGPYHIGFAGHLAADFLECLRQRHASLLAFRGEVSGNLGDGAGQVGANLLALTGKGPGELCKSADIECAGFLALGCHGACCISDSGEDQLADLGAFTGH